ncbi:MAG: EAL domain-containing protein [Gammaproteobacteria bacterium]
MADTAPIDIIFRTKLKLLAEQTVTGITATLITSFPLVLMLWNVTEHSTLLKWLTCVVILSALRYAHIYYYYKKKPDTVIHCKTWRLLFYSSFALSGLTWSLSIVLLAPKESIGFFAANILWVCAIIAGAIGSYSFLKRIFISFSLAACLPSIVYLFIIGDNIYTSMAIGVSVACGYMILSSYNLNKVININITNTVNEVNKSKKLSKQKNILNSIAEAAEFLLEDSWENSTHDFLKKLGTSINVSRIQIFENTLDYEMGCFTPNARFHWYSKSSPHYNISNKLATYEELNLTRWKEKLSMGESIYGNIDSFPEEERIFLQAINIQSLFILPIFVGNEWWGFISFDECKSSRTWDDEEIDALKTAAAVIGAAIKRTWDENKLSYHASHDSLTSLHNRRAFEVELKRLIQICERDFVEHILCYIDLDRFKIINDTCGHNAGDELLCKLSEVMKKSLRKGDFLARIGGDEFAVLLENISIDEAKNAIKTLQLSIDKYTFHYNNNTFRVGASIGIVPVNTNCIDPDKILQAADNACRAAKQSNTNQIRIYNVDDSAISDQKINSQSYIHINRALENDKFTLLFQPICKTIAVNEKWDKFEVLIRMHGDNGTLISPNRFLPTAERFNLIQKIDRWVFRASIKKLSKHVDLYNHVDSLSINISGATLCEPTFRNFVTTIFKEYEVPAEKICFEITETAAVSNLMEANNFINCLRNLGCKFALDDFGTGFSSFDNLKNLPVDFVKIDGSFIREINTNPIDYEMVSSLHRIAKIMQIETVAEFVESQDILDTLENIGITYVQGYEISKPLQLHELLDPNHRNIALTNTNVA